MIEQQKLLFLEKEQKFTIIKLVIKIITLN